MAKVLIIEDEPDIREGLARQFKAEDYEVAVCPRGDLALASVLRESPDVILLDVMLPGKDGLAVCRELRTRGIHAPLIMLTARADEIDRVVGLELGADDYVVKPFGIKEVLARVRAQLRRSEVRPAGHLPRQYRFGRIEVDFDRHTATRDGRPVELSPKELHLLQLLVSRRGEVVSRERMLRDVWGYDSAPNTRTVDTHILKLRQKLEDEPGNPRWLLSIYGEGYKFVG